MKPLLVALAILSGACGSKGNPAAPPPPPAFPTVAGTYTGTTTMTFPELGRSLTCLTTTVVTQSGASVNIAPLVLGGQCGNLSIPIGQETIDGTGAIQTPNTESFTEPSCGVYTVVGSGGFFGRELRFSVSATSATCYNFNMTVTLTR